MSGQKPNADQESFWDAEAGPVWVRNMRAMDVCLAPVLDLLLASAALKPGERVLDIGCGAGTSTFAAAQRVGPDGLVIGADISATLLTEARNQAFDGSVQFILADAQTYDFGDEAFDVMLSRFGVMFFDDSVAAFRNLASALRPGGRMIFATWGAIPANPYFTLPASVAKNHLGPRPRADPDAPGPFAFRNTDRVSCILAEAGLTEIKVDVVDTHLLPAGGAAGFAELAMQIGPAPGALEYFKATPEQASELRAKIELAAEAWMSDGELRLPAEINVFSATKA